MEIRSHSRSPSKLSIGLSANENSVIYGTTVLSIFSPQFKAPQFSYGKTRIVDENIKWVSRFEHCSGTIDLFKLSSEMKKGRGLLQGDEALACMSAYQVSQERIDTNLLIALDNKADPVFFLFENISSKEEWTNGKDYLDLLAKFNDLTQNYLSSEELESVDKWILHISYSPKKLSLIVSLTDEFSFSNTITIKSTPDRITEVKDQSFKQMNHVSRKLLRNCLSEIKVLYCFSVDLISEQKVRELSRENFDVVNFKYFNSLKNERIKNEIPVAGDLSLLGIARLLEVQKVALQTSLVELYNKQDSPKYLHEYEVRVKKSKQSICDCECLLL